MNDKGIHVDSFAVLSRRLRIYRIREKYTATLLWTKREAALHYLKQLEIQRLQVRRYGR